MAAIAGRAGATWRLVLGSLEMKHATHAPHHSGPHHADAHHAHNAGRKPSASATGADRLTATAFWATLHCLAGCAVGEVLGMVLGTAMGWGNLETIALAVVLAFLFGYAFTIVPLIRAGMQWRVASRLALVADTASITVMEIVDNAVMWLIPGAMDASVASPLFWSALALALFVALLAAWPVNRWLLARGKGHALVHGRH
jgi:Domain of unknown function (DUF4396)